MIHLFSKFCLYQSYRRRNIIDTVLDNSKLLRSRTEEPDGSWGLSRCLMNGWLEYNP